MSSFTDRTSTSSDFSDRDAGSSSSFSDSDYGDGTEVIVYNSVITYNSAILYNGECFSSASDRVGTSSDFTDRAS